MMPIKKWILWAAVAALVLTLLIILSSQMQRASAAELRLHEATLSTLSDAAEGLQAMSLSLEKLLISASPEQAEAHLADVLMHADRVRRNLTALPDTQAQMSPVLTWLSQVEDAARSHLFRLTDAQAGYAAAGTLSDMLANLRLLHAEIDLARQSMLQGSSITSALPATSIMHPPAAADLAAYRALPATEIGSGMALQLAKEFVGIDRVTDVSHAPDTTGAMPAFGVTVQTADLQLNVEVTQRGGKVLLMVPETAGFPIRQTPAACEAAAAAFLDDRGFTSMESTYYQVYDGLCVLTFVHVQEDVLVWSDRVLVQVRMDTAEVVGVEARSYWQHHIPRKIASPLLSAGEARAFLSPQVQEQSVRLCLLPINGQERLCWQFTVTAMDETYISYIDAITGRELLLEKVMQLESGTLAA